MSSLTASRKPSSRTSLPRPSSVPMGAALRVYPGWRDRHRLQWSPPMARKGAQFDEIMQAPLFSPGRQAVGVSRPARPPAICGDRRQGKRALCLTRSDGSPSARTAEARRLCSVQTGGDLRIVIDGSASTTEFGGFVHGATLVFDGPASFNTVVYRGPRMLGLHVELKEGLPGPDSKPQK